MALLKIFTVRDAKTEAYLVPFMVNHRGEALRGITECANDPKHKFCIYAEDFALFELGEFDSETAKFDLLAAPVHVVSCHELKKVDVPRGVGADPTR